MIIPNLIYLLLTVYCSLLSPCVYVDDATSIVTLLLLLTRLRM